VLDNGRVFFNAADSLVPADADGIVDPYEFEPSGVGSCSPTSAGAAFSVVEGGCVALLGSGATSAGESAIVDASSSGDDVFLLTANRLSSTDTDSAYDIYDAHVCGSGWACPPAASVTPPPCESASACHPGGSRGERSGLPGSSTFGGSGNVQPHHECSAPAHKARSLSARARRLRRDAKKIGNRVKAVRMHKKAGRFARRASRMSRQAKACRDRSRASSAGRPGRNTRREHSSNRHRRARSDRKAAR
jgi:hypothetical protein